MTRTRAEIAVTLAALLWGASGTVADGALAAGFGAVELGFWRLLIGGALFALHARHDGGLRLVQRADLLPMLAIGILVIGANYATFGLALERGGTSLVNLFIAMAPGFIAVGAFVWFGEVAGRGTGVLVLVGVIGLVLAALGGSTGVTVTATSVGFGVLTTLTIVAYTLGTTSLLRRYSPVTLSAYGMLIGATALLPFVRFEHRPLLAWLGVLALAVGPTYLGHLLYVRGLAVLGATTTGLLVTLETPVALGLAAVLVGERFTVVGIVGVALVVVSSALVIVSPRRRVRTRVGSVGRSEALTQRREEGAPLVGQTSGLLAVEV